MADSGIGHQLGCGSAEYDPAVMKHIGSVDQVNKVVQIIVADEDADALFPETSDCLCDFNDGHWIETAEGFVHHQDHRLRR